MQILVERNRLHDLAHADAIEIQDERHQHADGDDPLANVRRPRSQIGDARRRIRRRRRVDHGRTNFLAPELWITEVTEHGPEVTEKSSFFVTSDWVSVSSGSKSLLLGLRRHLTAHPALPRRPAPFPAPRASGHPSDVSRTIRKHRPPPDPSGGRAPAG